MTPLGKKVVYAFVSSYDRQERLGYVYSLEENHEIQFHWVCLRKDVREGVHSHNYFMFMAACVRTFVYAIIFFKKTGIRHT